MNLFLASHSDAIIIDSLCCYCCWWWLWWQLGRPTLMIKWLAHTMVPAIRFTACEQSKPFGPVLTKQTNTLIHSLAVLWHGNLASRRDSRAKAMVRVVCNKICTPGSGSIQAGTCRRMFIQVVLSLQSMIGKTITQIKLIKFINIEHCWTRFPVVSLHSKVVTMIEWSLSDQKRLCHWKIQSSSSPVDCCMVFAPKFQL